MLKDMSASALKIICHAFFHLAMSYGIIFWETHLTVPQMFACKKAIRIMEGCWNRISCRNLYGKLKICL